MLATWARYARIQIQHLRIGFIRKGQYRVEFISQVIMDLIWYTLHVLTFEVILMHTPSLAGWRAPELRVFLGFLFVSDAFMMMFLGWSWRFGRDLKDGKLDPYRVRPAAPWFLYFFQGFSPEGMTNGLFALGYLVWACVHAGVFHSVAGAAILLWAILLACWVRTFLMIGMSVAEFYLLNSDLGHFLFEAIHTTGTDYPLDIFVKRVRLFFILLLPSGVLTTVPAGLVAGRLAPLTGLAITAWMALFGVAIFAWWNRAFRRYESAMG